MPPTEELAALLVAVLSCDRKTEMKTIWKYKLSEETSDILMPIGAKILTVAMQDGSPHIWALVDPENSGSIRKIIVVGTGHPIPDCESRLYVGTYFDLGLVFHVFESS